MSTAPFFLQQFTDNAGKPLSAGKLFSYVGGSTNLPKPTFYDKDLTTQAPNPIILDASGTSPQYFMESGFYKFEVRDQNNVLIATRDYITAGDSSSSTSDHKVGTSVSDTNPDFLISKIVPGAGMDVVELIGSTRQIEITSKGLAKVSMSDSAGYLDSKFTSSPTITFGTNGYILSATVNPANVLDYKVKTETLDTTPAFLYDKFDNSSSVSFLTSGTTNKKVYAVINPSLFDDVGKVKIDEFDDNEYLDDKIQVGYGLEKSSIIGASRYIELSVNQNILSAAGKVYTSNSDTIPNYLSSKIKGGSGITITTTTDETDGAVMWVNSKTNLWTPIKYVGSSSYTVLDTDGTVVMTNDARSAVMFITLPTAGVNYLGRTVVIRGSSQWSGGVVMNTVIGSSGCGSNGTLTKGYEKNSFTCFYNNDTNSYVWYNDSWEIV